MIPSSRQALSLVMCTLSPVSLLSTIQNVLLTLNAGGSGFGMTTTYEEMRNASCTSCQIQQDLSNYWIPNLYYQGPNNGSFEDVQTIGGMTVYYLQRGENVTAFPPGFRMLAGTPSLRSYSDVPVQEAIGYVCLDYENGSSSTSGFPSVNCPQGLRAQVIFPSCWNGVDLDSTDHKSHLAYPDELSDGTCPEGFPVRLVTLFYEVTFVVDDFSDRWYSDRDQPFVWAMGDPTGYGLHGDMINGWDEAFLQSAIDTCLNGSGLEQDCDLFDLAYGQECHITPQVDEVVTGTLAKLPGCNPVQFGPGAAITETCPNDAIPTVWNTTYQYESSTAPPQSHFLANQAQTLTNYSSWEYIGCFSDQSSPRVLPISIMIANVTVESCLDYCATNDYQYGGLESGNECYCGSSSPSSKGGSSLAYSSCATSCSGNNLELCGGDWALTVYNNTANVVPTIPLKSTDLSATYVGCYVDNSQRIMPPSSLSSNNTVDGCVAACSATGNELSAVEYGGECYCAASLPAASLKTTDDQCNMQCDGERTELCGAGYRLQIYQGVPVSAAEAVKSMPYAGCYTDSTSQRSLAYQVSTDGTIENCLQTCYAQGYTIAGAEYASQCFCDDVVSSTMAKAAESDCNMPCSGDAQEICGGSDRLSIYNSTALVPATIQQDVDSWLYDGCWTDDASRVMTGANGLNSSVSGCIVECQGLGYNQSAVEYGGQCFCGTLASRSTRVADSECSMQCDSDPYHLCGAGYRLQLYTSSPAASTTRASTTSSNKPTAQAVAAVETSSSSHSSTTTGGRVALTAQASTSSSSEGREPLTAKPAASSSTVTNSTGARVPLEAATKLSTTTSSTLTSSYSTSTTSRSSTSSSSQDSTTTQTSSTSASTSSPSSRTMTSSPSTFSTSSFSTSTSTSKSSSTTTQVTTSSSSLSTSSSLTTSSSSSSSSTASAGGRQPLTVAAL